MEFVPLSDVELTYLAQDDPELRPVFHGVHPSNGLPRRPDKKSPVAYIVNTDPRGQPGQHWLAVWTDHGVCEVFDSYGLPLSIYEAPGLHDWLKSWKYVVQNRKTLQALNSAACGHYCVLFLKARVRGQSMLEFVTDFSTDDWVSNDHDVGERIRMLVTEDVRRLMNQHVPRMRNRSQQETLNCCK